MRCSEDSWNKTSPVLWKVVKVLPVPLEVVSGAWDEGGQSKHPPHQSREGPGGESPPKPLDGLAKVVGVDYEFEQAALWHRVVSTVVTLKCLLVFLLVFLLAKGTALCSTLIKAEANNVCLVISVLLSATTNADQVGFCHFVEDKACYEDEQAKEESRVVEVARKIAGTANKVHNEVVEEEVDNEVKDWYEHRDLPRAVAGSEGCDQTPVQVVHCEEAVEDQVRRLGQVPPLREVHNGEEHHPRDEVAGRVGQALRDVAFAVVLVVSSVARRLLELKEESDDNDSE